MSTRDAAVAAARRGWHVFPCRRDGDLDRDGHPAAKRPAVDDWERRACSDPDRVARHWPGPRHNVGIACGPSGLVVIDLDTHGELTEQWRLPGIRDGKDVLAQLCEWAGMPWPSTYLVATPSGGWHLYFTTPAGAEIRNSASLIGPQVDIRAAGGYVLAAGSIADGKPYELLDHDGPESLPGWIARLLAPQPESAQLPAAASLLASAPGRLSGLLRTVEGAPQGQRNDALYWAACRASEMVAAGEAGADGVTAFLVSAAAAAGLSESEARKTVASGLRGAR